MFGLKFKLSIQVTNNASNVYIYFVHFGLKFNFYFFSDRCTLKFLKVKCNPTNKEIVA